MRNFKEGKRTYTNNKKGLISRCAVRTGSWKVRTSCCWPGHCWCSQSWSSPFYSVLSFRFSVPAPIPFGLSCSFPFYSVVFYSVPDSTAFVSCSCLSRFFLFLFLFIYFKFFSCSFYPFLLPSHFCLFSWSYFSVPTEGKFYTLVFMEIPILQMNIFTCKL